MAYNILVALRVRPLINRELNDADTAKYWTCEENTIVQVDPSTRKKINSFVFDKVYDENTTNTEIYDDLAYPIVQSVLSGFNGTIFAYGQTSSGKTFTMTGNSSSLGVIPLAIQNIFSSIEHMPDREFLLRVSYMEIYKENIFDLLSDVKVSTLREDPHGQVLVPGLKEEVVTTEEMLLSIMAVGDKRRRVGETNMNERSSRSHSIFRLIIESRERGDKDCQGAVTVSHLNLVDLAGSENASQTGAIGERLKEGSAINKSLFMLGRVISQLSDGEPFINFRDSKLTRILQNSLGGNAKTVTICTVTSASREQTLSTVRFASRAKSITNKPIVNEVLSDSALLKRYANEIKNLKLALQNERSSDKAQEVEQVKEKLDEQEKRNQELKDKLKSLTEKLVVSSHSAGSISKELKKRRMTWAAPAAFRKPRMSMMSHLELPEAPSTLSQFETAASNICDGLPKRAVNFDPSSLPNILEEVVQESDKPSKNYSLCSFEGDSDIEERFTQNELSKLMEDSFLSPKAVPARRRRRNVNFVETDIKCYTDAECQTDGLQNQLLPEHQNQQKFLTPKRVAALSTSVFTPRGASVLTPGGATASTLTPRDVLRSRIERLGDLLEQRDDEFKDLEEFHNKELEAFKSRIELENELAFVKKSLSDSEGLYLESNKTVHEQSLHIDELNIKIERLQERVESFEKENAELAKGTQQNSSHLKDIHKLNKALKEKNEQIQRLKNDKLDFDMKMDLALEKQKKTESYLRNSLDDAWEEIAMYEKGSIGDVQERKSKNKNELLTTKEELKTLRKEKEDLDDKFTALKQQLENAHEDLLKEKDVSSQLSNELNVLKTEKDELQKTCSEMNIEIKRLKEKVNFNETTMYTCEDKSPFELTCMNLSTVTNPCEVTRKLSETLHNLDESLFGGSISPNNEPTFNPKEIMLIREQLLALRDMITQGNFQQQEEVFRSPSAKISNKESIGSQKGDADISNVVATACDESLCSPAQKSIYQQSISVCDYTFNASNNAYADITCSNIVSLADELKMAEMDSTVIENVNSIENEGINNAYNSSNIVMDNNRMDLIEPVNKLNPDKEPFNKDKMVNCNVVALQQKVDSQTKLISDFELEAQELKRKEFELIKELMDLREKEKELTELKIQMKDLKKQKNILEGERTKFDFENEQNDKNIEDFDINIEKKEHETQVMLLNKNETESETQVTDVGIKHRLESEVSDLREREGDLKKEIIELRTIKKDYVGNSEIEIKMEKEVTELKERETELIDLRNKNKILENKLTELSERESKLENELCELKIKDKNLEQVSVKLKRENESLNEFSRHVNFKVNQLNAKIDNRGRELKEVEKDFKETVETLKPEEEILTELRDKKTDSENEIESREKIIEELHKSREYQKDVTLLKTNEKVSVQLKENVNLEEKEESTCYGKIFEEEFSDLKEREIKLQIEVMELREREKTLESKVFELRERESTLENELKILEARENDSVKEVNKTDFVNELKNREELEKEVNVLKDNEEKHLLEINKLRKKEKELLQQITEYENTQKLSNKLVELRAEAIEGKGFDFEFLYQEQINELEKELSEARIQLEEFRTTVTESTERETQIKTEQILFKQIEEQLKKEIIELKKEKEEMRLIFVMKDANELEQEVNKLKSSEGTSELRDKGDDFESVMTDFTLKEEKIAEFENTEKMPNKVVELRTESIEDKGVDFGVDYEFLNQEQIKELEKELSDVRIQMEEFRTAVTESAERETQIKNELIFFKEIEKQLKKEITELKKEKEEMRLISVMKDTNELEHEVSNLRNNEETLKKELTDSTEYGHKLEREISELREKEDDLESMITDFTLKEEILEEKEAELIKKEALFEEVLKEKEDTLGKKEALFEQKLKEIDELINKDVFEDKVEEKEAKLIKNETPFEKILKEKDELIEKEMIEKSSIINKLKDKENELIKKEALYEEKLKEKSAIINQLKSKIIQLEEALKEFKKSSEIIPSVSKETDEKKPAKGTEECDGLKDTNVTDVDITADQIRALVKEKKNLESDLETLKDIIESCELEAKCSEEEKIKLENKLHEIKCELESKILENERLNSQCISLANEIEELKKAEVEYKNCEEVKVRNCQKMEEDILQTIDKPDLDPKRKNEEISTKNMDIVSTDDEQSVEILKSAENLNQLEFVLNSFKIPDVKGIEKELKRTVSLSNDLNEKIEECKALKLEVVDLQMDREKVFSLLTEIEELKATNYQKSVEQSKLIEENIEICTDRQHQIKILTENIELLENEKEDKVRENDKLNGKIQRLNGLLNSFGVCDLESLESELKRVAVLTIDLSESRKECQSIKSEVTHLQEEYEKVKAEVEELRETLHRNEINKNESIEVEKHVKACDEYETKIKLLTENIERLENYNEDKYKQLNTLKEKVLLLEVILEMFQIPDIEGIENELKKIEFLSEKLDQKNEECKVLISEKEALQVDHERVVSEMTELKYLHQKKICEEEKLNEEIEEQVKINKENENRIKSLNENITSLQEEKKSTGNKLLRLDEILVVFNLNDLDDMQKELDKVALLTNELDEMRVECDAMKSDIDLLSTDQENILVTLHETQDSLQEHVDALLKKEEEVKCLESDLDDVRKVHEECIEKELKHTMEVEKYINLIEKYEFEVSEKEENNKELNVENEDLKVELQNLSSKLKNSEDNQQMIEKELKLTTESLKSSKDHCENMTKEINKLKESKSSFEGVLNKVSLRFQDEKSNLEKRLLKTKEDLDDQLEKYNSLSLKHKINVKEYEERLKELQNSVKSLQQEKKILMESGNMEEKKSEDLSRLEGMVAILKKENESLMNSMEKFKEELQVKSQSYSDLSDEYDQAIEIHNQKIEDYRDIIKELKEENKTLNETLKSHSCLEEMGGINKTSLDCSSTHSANSDEALSLRKKLDNLKSENSKLIQTNSNLKDQYDRLNEKLSDAQTRLNTLQNSSLLQSSSSKPSSIQMSKQKLIEKIEKLDNKIFELENEVDTLRSRDGIIGSSEELEKQLEFMRREMRKTDYLNRTLNRNYDSMEKDVMELKENNEKLKEKLTAYERNGTIKVSQKLVEKSTQTQVDDSEEMPSETKALQEKYFEMKRENNVLKIEMYKLKAPIQREIQKWKDETKMEQERSKRLMAELRRVQNENICDASMVALKPSTKIVEHKETEPVCGYGSKIVLDIQVMELKNINYHLEKEKNQLTSENKELKEHIQHYKSKAQEWKTKCYHEMKNKKYSEVNIPVVIKSQDVKDVKRVNTEINFDKERNQFEKESQVCETESSNSSKQSNLQKRENVVSSRARNDDSRSRVSNSTRESGKGTSSSLDSGTFSVANSTVTLTSEVHETGTFLKETSRTETLTEETSGSYLSSRNTSKSALQKSPLKQEKVGKENKYLKKKLDDTESEDCKVQ